MNKNLIGIDVQSTLGRKTGLGIYTENLMRSLANESKNGFEFRFYKKSAQSDLNTFNRWLWENAELPQQARKDKVKILHVPAFAPPVFKTFKLVVTVHDLIGMLFPNQLGWPSRFYWGRWLPFAVKRADRVIADSENTKRDIVNRLGVDEKKIRVIYPSGHETFNSQFDPRALAGLKTQLGIQEKYFLFVGTLEPRKNLGRTLEAFAKFLKEKKMGIRYQMVVVGSKAFAHGKFFEGLHLPIDLKENDVIWADYVDHETLNLLYCGAEAFLFPSLYEGFGIPLLEAMACGAPVLTSNCSSTPEVSGEAALLVDPYDADQMAKAFMDLASNPRLRLDLITRGFQRIKNFSWRKTAQETFEVYESLL